MAIIIELTESIENQQIGHVLSRFFSLESFHTDFFIWINLILHQEEADEFDVVFSYFDDFEGAFRIDEVFL